ncbi:class I SAM-dependent DNA methyltransferase [Thiocapsa roseopersicina]|uniref:site-specific DNA-methyltransferase (adenine-specific) n=1 Tax=Thiocapsa roseopersicina TaxID=1058 RepID=A0A1H2UYY3_THIRO|nr:DNA methyltransferase [Thiocapsa roseopersicina]SDW61250.1 Type II restriction/modification system, DNA methylase subunit YeeA [Thiocapsa roseopersicina]
MVEQTVETFIKRWGGGTSYGGNERANLQMFITELCTLLDLPQPDPSGAKVGDNGYVFERKLTEPTADGGRTARSSDLYRRGCFILEGKDTGKQTGSSGWDAAIVKARNQSENYARLLPPEEGRPPFIVVVDVGRTFTLYAEFSRSGGYYVAFPDARRHTIRLEQLRDPKTRELLRTLWLDPLSLDPTRNAGKITRALADRLATLAKSLEADGHAPEPVAAFLMRCLFTMFAEDVGLLPERSFVELLERLKAKPESFCPQLRSLWQTMNAGGFSPALDAEVLRFNGGLFADSGVIALTARQIELLLHAACADWRSVEPAIFGTLLERALDPRERHKLGAHYTPRAYVERLVLPTVIEPLRAEWAEVQAAALAYRQKRKIKEAVAEIRAFLHQLSRTRVLDPACGSGNFLYVALEHMKRLEGEVLEVLGSLVKSGSFELEGLTVDPHQFIGLEINPRAARIAEIVLWIGYLQWHFRTYGKVNPPEPVLRDFHNIENRDALIDYDAVEVVCDADGQPVTRWDGITFKTSPITGEKIPDETAQVEQLRYLNPRKAAWPQADFIVGNPPFIGASTMRRALGDGYVDAVRRTWPEVPESADFVMHWWHIAAEQARAGAAKRFGFITTNSIRQTFNRRVIQAQLEAKNPLSLAFAIPDHPWVDAADGAQVRIAMTVGTEGEQEGRLLQVCEEINGDQDEIELRLQERQGRMFADLKTGANVASAQPLRSTFNISSPGVKLHGAGFIVTPEEAQQLGLGSVAGLERHIRDYRNGRDLTQSPRGAMLIDLFGLTADEVRIQFPAVYQWVLERVKPERDAKGNTKDGAGYAALWWIFGKPRQELRKQLVGLPRHIATVETAKHRTFQFLDAKIMPDNMLINIASDDAAILGVLSSRLHVAWALAAGGRLGVGNDPRYNKTRCFETFPFPDATPEQQTTIRALAEQLDAHRKRRQAAHPELTLTGMYNLLEKLRAGAKLTAKDKTIHTQGLVSLLRELHDNLDRAVFAAYGWDDLAERLVGLPGATTPLPDKPAAQTEAEEELLRRLVELNAERAAEESRGRIRWLRPDYQNPGAAAPEQIAADVSTSDTTAATSAVKVRKLTWPKGMREQIAAVLDGLGGQTLTLEELSARFKDPAKTTPLIVEALAALEDLGRAERANDRYRAAG